MKIGLPAEIKDGERRIALLPEAVGKLAAAGHEIVVEAGAGARCGFGDALYLAQGARIVATAAGAFDADLVVKVKEIQPGEWQHLRPSSMLFCYLQLITGGEMAGALLQKRVTGLSFETVEGAEGGLPLLKPMSVIAGELAMPIAAHLLMTPQGGRGVMLRDARVVILGAGSAGRAAASVAAQLGADVTLLSRAGKRLEQARGQLPAAISIQPVSGQALAEALQDADVLIGAINVPGAPTPKLVSRDALRTMGPGAVFIDICIDGGGVAESSRPTKHSAPTFVDEGVIHYCVANMPAAVPQSASRALSAAIIPYVESLAANGLTRALRADPGLAAGLQTHGGQVTNAGVAAALGRPYCDLDALLHSCQAR